MTATTVAATEPVREDAGLATAYRFILGSLLADPIWGVVSVPTRAGVVKLATLAGILMPALTGIVDLILRARIP